MPVSLDFQYAVDFVFKKKIQNEHFLFSGTGENVVPNITFLQA